MQQAGGAGGKASAVCAGGQVLKRGCVHGRGFNRIWPVLPSSVQQSSQVKYFTLMRQLQLAQAVAVFQFTLENGAVMRLTDATYFGASAFGLKINFARRHSQGGFVVQWDAFLAQVIAG